MPSADFVRSIFYFRYRIILLKAKIETINVYSILVGKVIIFLS